MTQGDCSICLDSLDSTSLNTRCGHSFHKNCIDKWIDSFHWKCPLCRGQLAEITQYKPRMFDLGDSQSLQMVYPLEFNGQIYAVKEKDYLEVRDRFNFSSLLLNNEEYKSKVIMPIIFFSIMKTNNLEEAYHKAKPVLSQT